MKFLKKLSCLLAALLLLSVGVSAAKEDVPNPVDTAALVYDYADLLTDGEEASLRTTLENAGQSLGFAVVVVTTRENPQTAMQYADDFYDYNQFPSDGILYLIDLDNGDLWISTSGACIGKYQNYIESLLDACYPAAKQKDYAASCNAFVSAVKKAKEENFAAANQAETGADAENALITPGIVIASLVVALIVMLALIIRHKSVRKGTQANSYMDSNDYALRNRNVVFIGTHTTSRKISSDNGGSGGGGTHIGSSGASHGGGGRSL